MLKSGVHQWLIQTAWGNGSTEARKLGCLVSENVECMSEAGVACSFMIQLQRIRLRFPDYATLEGLSNMSERLETRGEADRAA